MGSDKMRQAQPAEPAETEVQRDDMIDEGAPAGAASRTKAGFGASGRRVAEAATGAKDTVRDAVQDVGKTVADATRHVFR
jgi:hypothetical protein